MSRCRNWAACSAATGLARRAWPSTASACRPAPTTGRSNSRNGRLSRPDGLRLGDAGALGDGARRRCLRRADRTATGLVDPPTIIRPTGQQVDDLMAECRDCALRGERVLVTTLTKKMAEALTIRVHCTKAAACRVPLPGIPMSTRSSASRSSATCGSAVFDVLSPVSHLLREGLDIPECALVAGARRRQGGLSALSHLADPDDRPRRAPYRRPRHPLRRPYDRQPQGSDRGDRPGAARSSRSTTPPTASRRKACATASADILQKRLRGRPRHGRARRERCRALSGQGSEGGHRRSRKAGCAPPPPISNSRRRRGCATRSAGLSRPSSASSPPAMGRAAASTLGRAGMSAPRTRVRAKVRARGKERRARR